MIRLIKFVLLIMIPFQLAAQHNSFYHYLISNGFFSEAEEHVRYSIRKAPVENDTLFFRMALCKLRVNQYDSAVIYFGKITNQPLYKLSRLMNTEIYIKKNQIVKALEISEATPINWDNSPEMVEMQSIQESGIFLLSGALDKYEHQIKEANARIYFKNKSTELNQHYRELKSIKNKSPLLAGVYSAVIPGLGKIYASKYKQGLASFGVNLILFAQAAEAFRKNGFASPGFIVFGGLAGLFYVSNIYGSVLSVSVAKQQRINQINNEIKATISIPVHRFFE